MRLIIFFVILSVFFVPASYGEMYKWVDEKGTVHFTDDPSSIPEKYREGVETRKPSKETPVTNPVKTSEPVPAPINSIPEGITVDLQRQGEVLYAEVVLNGSVKQKFIVDTGASFTNISYKAAKELGITIDESTPYLTSATASSFIVDPLVTLNSVRVGEAEVKDVDVLVSNLPGGLDGLLGNSFLFQFKVVLDSINGKMTLHPLQGIPSLDRPGGYGKDYWAGRFQFYSRILENLKRTKKEYENKGPGVELKRVDNALRYFGDKLDDLDRKASFAGVPRNWRQ